MKNLASFMKISKIVGILSISSFFLGNCISTKKNSGDNFFENQNKISFFQKTKLNQNQSYFFEKNTNKVKYLLLQKEENSYSAREIQIFIFSYRNDFLEKIKNSYPEVNYGKYHIREIVKTGHTTMGPDKESFSIKFEKEVSRDFEGNEIVETLDGLKDKPYNKAFPISEEVKYSFREDGNLWKSEEQIKNNSKKKFTWKHHEVGGIIKRFAFTEFLEDSSEKRISRISEENDFILKKMIKENSSKTYKLFSTKNYAIYYFPGEDDKFDYSNIVPLKKSKTQLTLYKNNFPILVFKKSLK